MWEVDQSEAKSEYSPVKSQAVEVKKISLEVKDKVEQLRLTIEEEKRLTNLIQDPPVQYRKQKIQRELKEDLKKAQRNIYELNYQIRKEQSQK
jgi:hypothetical protein